MTISHVCQFCHDLVEVLASKQLDHLHYLVLLKCGHYFIQHEPGSKFNDLTKERDYCFEIKFVEEKGYWICDTCLLRHCHACDGETKVHCCKCYQEKFDSTHFYDKWCEFCQFWYEPILCPNCGKIESDACCISGIRRRHDSNENKEVQEQ